MSVYAYGTVTMKMKCEVPEEVIKTAEKNINLHHAGMEYEANFDGNWYLDDVIDAVKPLDPYIKSGNLTYWCDEGDSARARATFVDGIWVEEWQETYYPSDLPTREVSSTDRVSKILNTIAENLEKRFGYDFMKHFLMYDCYLSKEEVKMYKLDWIKEETKTENKPNPADIYNLMLNALPSSPAEGESYIDAGNKWHGFWGDNISGEIMCEDEEKANILADLFEDLGFDPMHTHLYTGENEFLYSKDAIGYWSFYPDS